MSSEGQHPKRSAIAREGKWARWRTPSSDKFNERSFKTLRERRPFLFLSLPPKSRAIAARAPSPARVLERDSCWSFVSCWSSKTPVSVISKSERSRVRSWTKERKWERPESVIFRHLERSSILSLEAHPPRTKEDKPPSSKFPQDRRIRTVRVRILPTRDKDWLVTLVLVRSRWVRKPPLEEEKPERKRRSKVPCSRNSQKRRALSSFLSEILFKMVESPFLDSSFRSSV